MRHGMHCDTYRDKKVLYNIRTWESSTETRHSTLLRLLRVCDVRNSLCLNLFSILFYYIKLSMILIVSHDRILVTHKKRFFIEVHRSERVREQEAVQNGKCCIICV